MDSIEEMQRKETFFQELSALDNKDEGPEDTSGVQQLLADCRNASRTPGRIITAALHASPTMKRTISVPLPLSTSPWSEHVVKETPHFPRKSSMLGVHASKLPSNAMIHDTPRASAVVSKANKKRKRGQSLDLVPASQQVFRGLYFFYIPNDDINPARKLRMKKAKEHGAIRVEQWRTKTTHIVVDKGIKYNNLLSHLELSELPPDVILVNDTYPLDCIDDKILFNPLQRQYQIDGQPDPNITKISSPSASSSGVSLPVKSNKARPLQSPSRSGVEDEATAINIIHRDPKESAANEKTSIINIEMTRTDITDALDAAISEAKALEHLPLDSESDAVEEMLDDGSDDEVERRPKISKKTQGPFDASRQKNFSCMQKNDGARKSENPNARTIEVLQQMADYYDRTYDHWRTLSYRKAIGQLRKQNTKIATKAEAFALPFIGDRLADKIEEIVWTNRLRRLESTTLEPNDESLQTFLKIYGVGFAQATVWVNQGLRTLDDLKSKAKLTKNQQIGMEHYEDFLTRIPRAEVENHVAFVKAIIATVDPKIQIIIGGSYRRGSPDSGDVDYIVTHPSASVNTLRTLLLESIIPRLFSLKYLTCALASTSPTTGTKWHGAAMLSSSTIWRRVDFLIVPPEELGAALIYFTGNDIFNRSIRLLASKKGMRLNQRGLWKDVARGPGRENITEGTLVEGRSEEKIFEVLGVPWRPPEHRIC